MDATASFATLPTAASRLARIGATDSVAAEVADEGAPRAASAVAGAGGVAAGGDGIAGAAGSEGTGAANGTAAAGAGAGAGAAWGATSFAAGFGGAMRCGESPGDAIRASSRIAFGSGERIAGAESSEDASAFGACAIAGSSAADLLRPSVNDAAGSGTQRLYSYRDLVALKVIKSLLDAGVSLQTARKAIDYLRNNLGDDHASASLVLAGGDSVLASKDDQIIDLVRQGQGVLNIGPLGPVQTELDAKIVELGPAAEQASSRRVAPHAPRAVND